MASVFAASLEANAILGVFLLIAGFGFVLGFFTVRGSGINGHPWDGRESAPGSKLPDEFHQFADRQLHDADMRRAVRDERVEARLTEETATVPRAARPAVPPDDPTLDEINRRLAAEARARKAAKRERSGKS
jgi:hypothetical protein